MNPRLVPVDVGASGAERGPLLVAEAYAGAGAWATIGVVQAVGSILGGAVALRWQPQRPLRAALGAGLLDGAVPGRVRL